MNATNRRLVVTRPLNMVAGLEPLAMVCTAHFPIAHRRQRSHGGRTGSGSRLVVCVPANRGRDLRSRLQTAPGCLPLWLPVPLALTNNRAELLTGVLCFWRVPRSRDAADERTRSLPNQLGAHPPDSSRRCPVLKRRVICFALEALLKRGSHSLRACLLAPSQPQTALRVSASTVQYCKRSSSWLGSSRARRAAAGMERRTRGARMAAWMLDWILRCHATR